MSRNVLQLHKGTQLQETLCIHILASNFSSLQVGPHQTVKNEMELDLYPTMDC